MAFSTATISDTVPSNTRLRHLKLKSWRKIVDVLSSGNNWLEVATSLKKPNNENELMFSSADISKLESQFKSGSSPAEAFLQHWSTSGIKQPTVLDLINVLIDVQLFRAADTISQALLKTPISVPKEFDIKTEELLANIYITEKKETNQVSGEFSDTIYTFNKTFSSDSTSKVSNLPTAIPVELPFPSSVASYCYKFLSEVTGNFCDIPVCKYGYKLGEGAFGVVYRAHANEQWIAVKKLKESVDKQFFNELEVLSEYKHENLLPLLGYSNDGPYSCLVYLYMPNGSLQERLACVNEMHPMPWSQRISIAFGTAKGINHLHTFRSPSLVHRDIKSANILLDDNMVPKVGDFGLARIGDSGMATTAAFTSNIYGTSVYMAREAFHGEISTKLDTFSFGVVVLELLTGLPPYDASRSEDRDLITYMESNCSVAEDIVHMLDVKAGKWDEELAVSLFKTAKSCIEPYKRDRPTIEQILPDIEQVFEKCEINDLKKE